MVSQPDSGEIAVKLHLSPPVQDVLRQRASRTGKDIATVVTEVLEEAVAAEVKVQPEELTPEQRVAAWQKWAEDMRQLVKEHVPPGHIADDSRESIYEGCGE